MRKDAQRARKVGEKSVKATAKAMKETAKAVTSAMSKAIAALASNPVTWVVLVVVLVIGIVAGVIGTIVESAGASNSMDSSTYQAQVSDDVEAYRDLVEKYCEQYEIDEYVDFVLGSSVYWVTPIPYVINESKTNGLWYSNVGVSVEQITDAFMLTKQLHPTRGKRQGYHYKFSFSKDEDISAEDALAFVK